MNYPPPQQYGAPQGYHAPPQGYHAPGLSVGPHHDDHHHHHHPAADAPVIVTASKGGANHVLWCIITVLTGGLALPCWLCACCADGCLSTTLLFIHR